MVVERENLLDEKGLPKKPLRLSKLPFLMRKKAINFMSSGEKIRLAVASEDMENYVNESRLDKYIHWTLKICDSSSSIIIYEGKVEVAVTDNFPAGDMEGDKIPKREIAKWCDDKKEPTENVKIILKKLQNLLTCSVKPQEICLDLNVAEQRIFEILTDPVYKNANELDFRNFRLETRTIDKILEFCEFKSLVSFTNLAFPNDYYHEKALKCKNIYYGNAIWMRVTQLLTLRDRATVYLGDTFLDMEDIAILVNFWVTVDYDMFRNLDIHMRESTGADFGCYNVGALEVVGFEEVAAFFSRSVGEKFYLIMSKPKNPAKKYQMLVVQIANYVVRMKAAPIEIFAQHIHNELIDILNLVHLKNEKEISLGNFRFKNELEDDVAEFKRALRAEIQELKQRLMNLSVQVDEEQDRLVRDPPPAVE
ncbi:hypothetical protein CAEBREN_15683 [Caenorhabditis brenneri]|uniref:F-box associated domain-containing protein n=1 Tax=Caenorhabditis brenneri TaxID=135651 RepID=G0N766_CAEBE|nr:hypothetical protein CAEBREN_15683 [Caenorhabditis brenneri]